MSDDCAGIFKQSIGARKRVGIGLSYLGTDSWAPLKKLAICKQNSQNGHGQNACHDLDRRLWKDPAFQPDEEEGEEERFSYDQNFFPKCVTKQAVREEELQDCTLNAGKYTAGKYIAGKYTAGKYTAGKYTTGKLPMVWTGGEEGSGR
jgi:hypothetical protein